MLFDLSGHGSDEDGNYGLDYYYTTTITPTPITPTRCNGKTLNDIDVFYEDPDFNYYITAHEQSLGHAVTGYAKVSGKTGVAIVTGPGLTNMVTPILDVTNDSAPLLCLSGQVPLSAMGLSAFQECPATEITKSITKLNYYLQSTEEIPYVIDHAMWVAQHGKKGAVHIEVPKCVSAGISDEIFNMCSHNENPDSDEFYLYSYHDNLEKANKFIPINATINATTPPKTTTDIKSKATEGKIDTPTTPQHKNIDDNNKTSIDIEQIAMKGYALLCLHIAGFNNDKLHFTLEYTKI